MRTRIGTRVILAVGGSTALTIGFMSALILKAQQTQLIAEVHRSANQLSETIKGTTHYDMLENRRASLHRQIEAIGRQEGIESVRVFNKEGEIVFSSGAAEIGRSVDKRAEACTACHAVDRPLEKLPIDRRSRIFQAADGHRVLGIINPIQNEPSCSEGACHAHGPRDTVLGVLDITMSLAEVDRSIARGQIRMAGLAVAAIGAGSLILWWLNRRLVLRPVESLLTATRRVAGGDLATRIPVTGSHELGDLARAFNEMTGRLAEAQIQINQADKLASVGRLAAGVAHEINNPLTGVLTYASFQLKRAEGNSELKEDLEVIVRETKRCRDIVKGLLDFARQTPPKRQATDLNEVVRRAVAIMMNQLALNRVGLELDLADALPPVLADANQMQQVVVNLLVNAADSLEEGRGRIRLATRRATLPPANGSEPRPVVDMTVEDTGRGIPAADLSRLFEPFFTTKGPRGTGLGLAVTWGIVDSHGGSIDVASEEGKGTRFTVHLPLDPDAVSAAATAEAAAVPA
jgi:two-component system, NtrC family, sensor kinase